MSFAEFFFLFPLIIVPIIIHLLSKKKLKKIDFPSLLFVIKNEVRLIRWFQLKGLLLLILRVALLVSLILAAVNLKVLFSFLDSTEILILDKSPSMENYRIDDRNIFVVPTRSGIPQFSPFFKKCRTGVLITDAQKNGFTEILKKREKFPGIRIKRTAFPEGNVGIISAKSGPCFEDEKNNIIFGILNEYKEGKRIKFTLKSDGKIVRKEERIIKEGITDLNLELSQKKGLHQLFLELEDEKGFSFDNKYYFVLNVQSRKKINIISKHYPARLIAALNPLYFEVALTEKTSDIKGDLFIACDVEEIELGKLLRDPRPGIICLGGEGNTSISNKIPDKVSTIVGEYSFNGSYNLNFLSEIPINYNCIIIEGEPLVYFKNSNMFVSKIENHLILPIPLEGNDLSLHPAFIPFLFALINSLSDETFHDNILSDEPIIIRSSFLPIMLDPEGNEYKMDAVSESVYIFRKTKICGIYKITDGKSIRGLIAVNNHPSESKLERLSDEEISYIFGKSGLKNGASFFLVVAFIFFVLSVFVERRR
jgi:hypothetical protein